MENPFLVGSGTPHPLKPLGIPALCLFDWKDALPSVGFYPEQLPRSDAKDQWYCLEVIVDRWMEMGQIKLLSTTFGWKVQMTFGIVASKTI